MSSENDKYKFLARHPCAKYLGPNQLAFAMSLGEKHKGIRVYRSGGNVILSREAMWTPGVREPFFVRQKGEAKL